MMWFRVHTVLACGFFHPPDGSRNEWRASGEVFNGGDAQRLNKGIDRSGWNDADLRHLHQRPLVLIAYPAGKDDVRRSLLLSELMQPWQVEPLTSDNQDSFRYMFFHNAKCHDQVIDPFFWKHSPKVGDDPGGGGNAQ